MKANQKGFNSVEILVAILVVLLVGGGGLYVWQRQHKTKTNTDSSIQKAVPPTQTVTTTETKKDETKYLEIKEWGVRGKLTGTQTLTYSFKGGNLRYADFTTEEFKKAYADCGYQATWSIGRGKAGEYIGETDFPINEHADAVKVGDYYYTLVGSSIACSGDTSTKLQQAGEDETKALILTFEPIPAN